MSGENKAAWDERMHELAGQDQVGRMTGYFEEHFGDIIDDVVAVCELPAPSFDEEERAKYVARRLRELAADDVIIDDYGNVIGRYPGVDRRARLAVLAHLDTVFPRSVDVTVKEDGQHLAAPGIGDNSTSVAALLHLVAAWKRASYTPPFDVLVVGNVCEEGLGDLRGVKGLLDGYAQRDDVDLAAVIPIDGKLGSATNAGIGSRRLKVTFEAQGGHSWADFGKPSAVHAMGAAIEAIARLEVPEDPRTSYNVGVVEGGTSVNTIAQHATMLIDMRSVSLEPLREVEGKIRRAIQERCAEFGAEYEIEVVGDRPVGRLEEDHPLVQLARAAGKQLDIPIQTRAASTDANVPLSRDIPAVTIGIYEGEGAHRENEWMLPSSLHQGLPLGLLIVLGTINWISGSLPVAES